MKSKAKKKKKRGVAGSTASGPAAASPAAAASKPPASHLAGQDALAAILPDQKRVNKAMSDRMDALAKVKGKTVKEKRAAKAAQREAENGPNPVGRPPEWDKVDALMPILLRAAKGGATNLQMAIIADISEKSWYNYQNQHPEFLQAIKAAKVIPDDNVEHALYERATGYSHPEDKVFYDTATGKEVIVPTVRHYPPDTAAIMAWLTNRRGGKWKHRQSILHGGEIKAKVVQVNLPKKSA